jgi:K+-sensing histidine kinase KdpD
VKISHRLYLTAAPSLLGMLLVAALAYWGQYAHAVPEMLVVIVALAVVASMILSWQNARYVAQRIARLAGASSERDAGIRLQGVANALMPGSAAGPPDELDRIEGVVDHLSSAVAEAETHRSAHEAAAERRVKDYADMLATIAARSADRLEEVRIPLHILLENHFGDLNENQEEMLGAARNAAEAVDADLVALRQVAELDVGTRELRRDRLLPGDLVRSLLPTLQSIADKQSATLEVDLEPLVPAIRGDQPALQDALAVLIGGTLRSATAGAELRVSVHSEPGAVRIEARGGGLPARDVRTMLAERVVRVSGGSVDWSSSAGLTIRFPTIAATR